MRYLPNLIPDSAKVLPDYFKGDSYDFKQSNTATTIFSYIGAVCFFIIAVAIIKHPYLTILFATLGFLFLPQGHKWIERTCRFRLTTKIKSVFCGALLIGSIPLTLHYHELDRQETQQEKIQQEKEQQAKIEAEKKEQIRKDSLNYFIQQGATLAKANKQDVALKNLSYALVLATSQDEKDKIQKNKLDILIPPVLKLVKAGNYKTALPKLTELINQSPNNSDLLYNRAICYSKTGKMQQAVDDLKVAIQLGNQDAEKYQDKINPMRKKIIGYETVCCDGSTSSTSGRGACSHHGGVCGSRPIYDEGERKYK